MKKKLINICIVLTIIIALNACKKVNYSDAFVTANKGKITCEVPEASELVNIVIALALDKPNSDDTFFVYQHGAYYNDVTAHFSKYKNETVVEKFREILRLNFLFYVTLRSDIYAYEFDSNDRISRKKEFNSLLLPAHNFIIAHQDELQEFSDKTNFRKFYKDHKSTYDYQCKYYLDTANVPKMITWLSANYPDGKSNAVGISLSPLCYASQNTTAPITDNGLQKSYLFINYPYLDGTEEATDLRRGALAFTELNHNYENQEAEKSIYRSRLEKVFADNKWETDGARKIYPKLSGFQEYINWSLTSLWYYDNESDTAKANYIIRRNETNQVENRGFLKFKEFNQFFLNRYKNKKPGETIAAMYPEIVDWFEKN
jgi:hypothetical protein